MTAQQQALAFIRVYGYSALDVASEIFKKYNEKASTTSSVEKFDAMLLYVKSSNYWFSVTMSIYHLQNY